MITVLFAVYWALVALVLLSAPVAIYVIGCCAVDAFAHDPWLDGPRLSDLATDQLPRRAYNRLDRAA